MVQYPIILGCGVAGTVKAMVPGSTAASHFCIGDRVFGLCSATSGMFLFGKDYLNLEYPKLGVPKKGKTVLVWGGSSAAGSNAIQLATAAGYDIIATCSKKNFDYVKSLGTAKVFDYTDLTKRVSAELDKSECAGIFMAACTVAAASKQT